LQDFPGIRWKLMNIQKLKATLNSLPIPENFNINLTNWKLF